MIITLLLTRTMSMLVVIGSMHIFLCVTHIFTVHVESLKSGGFCAIFPTMNDVDAEQQQLARQQNDTNRQLTHDLELSRKVRCCCHSLDRVLQA